MPSATCWTSKSTSERLLPPDDSARGFDNIAGSLTISPTLLEAYTTAAARVARMAVGYWKSPTESTYLAPGDTSQNQHIEGLPFGTRGGMLVRHDFPADGEYTVLDPELRDRQLHSRRAARAHHRRRESPPLQVPRRGHELGNASGRRWIPGSQRSGQGRLTDGRCDVHRDQLPAEPGCRQAIRTKVAREQRHPSNAVLPGHRVLTRARTVRCAASRRLAQHPQGLYLPARQRQPRGGLRESHPLDAGAARLSASSGCARPGGPDGVLSGRPQRRHVRRGDRAGDFGGC